jgi:hypothetical protein
MATFGVPSALTALGFINSDMGSVPSRTFTEKTSVYNV